MLFQTLVQLNILILATPALAGWSVLPPVHAGTFRTACVVWQFRAVETVAPKAEAQTRQAETPSQVALLRPQSVFVPRPAPQKICYVATPTVAVISCHPFPHAIRAP